MADKLTARSEDFPRYIRSFSAELADYGPSKGSMIIRPYGYALWENIQAYLDARFKKNGVKTHTFHSSFLNLSLPKKQSTSKVRSAPRGRHGRRRRGVGREIDRAANFRDDHQRLCEKVGAFVSRLAAAFELLE
jgi:hypothetical protein